VLQEISEFDTQFASLSEFDTGTVNSFSLGVSHLFSPFSLFYISFLVSKPGEKTKMPLAYPFSSRLLPGPHDCSHAISQSCIAASQACLAPVLNSQAIVYYFLENSAACTHNLSLQKSQYNHLKLT